MHQIRASTKYLAYKDRKPFCRDLKAVYAAPTLQAAETALEALEEKWGIRYPLAVKPWREKWDRLTTFFRYPMELRKIIYTTNSIEGLNGRLRKNTKNRRVFPTDESLIKLLYLNIQKITAKWTTRHNWNIVVNQLSILFPGRLENVQW